MAATHRGEKAKDDDDTSPLQWFLWSAFFLAMAVGAYLYLHHAEQVGGTVRLPVIVWPVYELVGTWGIVGLLGLFALLGLTFGARGLRAGRRSRGPRHI